MINEQSSLELNGTALGSRVKEALIDYFIIIFLVFAITRLPKNKITNYKLYITCLFQKSTNYGCLHIQISFLFNFDSSNAYISYIATTLQHRFNVEFSWFLLLWYLECVRERKKLLLIRASLGNLIRKDGKFICLVNAIKHRNFHWLPFPMGRVWMTLLCNVYLRNNNNNNNLNHIGIGLLHSNST